MLRRSRQIWFAFLFLAYIVTGILSDSLFSFLLFHIDFLFTLVFGLYQLILPDGRMHYLFVFNYFMVMLAFYTNNVGLY
jgi:hypothetical protein